MVNDGFPFHRNKTNTNTIQIFSQVPINCILKITGKTTYLYYIERGKEIQRKVNIDVTKHQKPYIQNVYIFKQELIKYKNSNMKRIYIFMLFKTYNET